MTKETPPPNLETEYFRSYEDYSKNLRLWFLTYGVGATVALLSSSTALATLVEAKCSYSVGFYLILGVLFQVLGTFLNKFTQLTLAFPKIIKTQYPEKYDKLKQKNIWKISDWYSEQNWIDFLFDYQTLVFYTKATILTFQVLSEKSGAIVCVQEFSLSSAIWFVALWGVGICLILWNLGKMFFPNKNNEKQIINTDEPQAKN